MDTSVAVHDDMKSRTGLCTILGKGTVYAVSTKQKLNVISSTESSLVGVLDGMPKTFWTRYFMKAQGYNVEDMYVYQDNQSALLLDKKGMKSIGKKSRHIRIKYFFITDRVKDNDSKIMYCPTKEMMADFSPNYYRVSYLLIIGILYLESPRKICYCTERNMRRIRNLMLSTNYDYIVLKGVCCTLLLFMRDGSRMYDKLTNRKHILVHR